MRQTNYSKERIEACKLESYNPNHCCGQNCDWLGKDSDQPCYGDVNYLGLGKHGCVGHQDMELGYVRQENSGC